MVGVPLKYRWCSVPITPPERKMLAATTEVRPATAAWTSPRRTNRNAMITVANTSKKPSTQRWTTHQRQYSVMARLVWRPAPSAAK